MSCCGRARANLGVSLAARRPAGTGTAPAVVDAGLQLAARVSIEPGAMQTLRYIGGGGVTVRGPATGRPYVFSTSTPTLAVDAQDAMVLLRTAYFRRA
jgi:hypothetical protein